MHFLDSIFIFVLALVLFGPKRLPEIGRQIGKLLVEFRRASNDFKMQIEDELRTMEQQDRQKKLEAAAAQSAALPAPETAALPAAQPAILPPSTGAPVSADAPYAPMTPPELPPAAAPAPANHAMTETTSNGHAPVNQQEQENEQAQLHHG
jgi:sec-independent protein translocase protein TatB